MSVGIGEQSLWEKGLFFWLVNLWRDERLALPDKFSCHARVLTVCKKLWATHEQGHTVEAIQHHRQVFGQPPRLVAEDRGVHSAEIEEVLTQARRGSSRWTSLPSTSSRRNGKR